MKKIILATCTLIVAVFGSHDMNAQAFKKGKNYISIGYGFPNLTRAAFTTYRNNNSYDFSGVGPLHLKLENAITDNIGIGLSVNAVFNEVSYVANTFNYKANYSSIKFNARFNYHFKGTDNFDPYIGAGFGYGTSEAKWTSNEPNYNGSSLKNPVPIGMEATVGCRYFFTDNIGIYAEGGLAKSIMQVGLTVKL